MFSCTWVIICTSQNPEPYTWRRGFGYMCIREKKKHANRPIRAQRHHERPHISATHFIRLYPAQSSKILIEIGFMCVRTFIGVSARAL